MPCPFHLENGRKKHARAGRSAQLALSVFLFFVALGFAKDAAASIKFVQSTSTSQSSGRWANKAFPNNVTAGDLIIVGVFADVGAPATVGDIWGDTYTQVAHQTVASSHDADVFVGTASISGADTITVNAGSGENVYAFSIHEYSGVTTAVDASTTAQGNSTAPASGSLTTTSPNDLIFAWFTNGNDFQNENFNSLNAAYTKREMSGSGTAQCIAIANCVESADLVASTTLTTNATATLSVSDVWSATVVAFKGAPKFVQSTSTSQNSGRWANKAFPNNVTAGDLIIVGVFVDVGAPATVGDILGDTYTQVAHQTVASNHDADVFVGTASISGADTITVNAGSGENVYAFSIHEYSGATTAVDVSTTAQGNSTAPASGSLTTTSPNDLIFAWFTNGNDFQNENFNSLNAAYTKREMSGSGTAQCIAIANCVESADLVASTTLTTNATATLSVSDVWSATVVAFKRAASTLTSNTASTAGSTGPAVSLSPSTLAFGSEPVDMTSPSQVVTLSNTGSAALNITSITFTDANASSFLEANTCGSSVAAGGNCTIAVLFTPSAAGALTASLSISDNASGSPQSVSLSGTGTHDVILTWTPSTTSGIAGYYVFRGTTSDEESATPLNSSPITCTTYIDTNVQAGQGYYYWVTAISSNGVTQSPHSNQASATVP